VWVRTFTDVFAASLLRQAASPSCPTAVIGLMYDVSASDPTSVQPLLPEDVPAGLATHAVFANVGVDAVTAMVSFPSSDASGHLMDRFISHVTSVNPCIKPLLGIGPADANDLHSFPVPWSAIAASKHKRTTFALAVVNTARARGFSGIQLVSVL
jgi:hypothetical protein